MAFKSHDLLQAYLFLYEAEWAAGFGRLGWANNWSIICPSHSAIEARCKTRILSLKAGKCKPTMKLEDKIGQNALLLSADYRRKLVEPAAEIAPQSFKA